MHSSILLTLTAVTSVLAQYGNSDATTTAASAASSSTASADGVHIIKVGEDGLAFDPQELTAAVGDTVEFHFYPMAHSVAQSSFALPCEPLNDTSFFSGPVAVSSGVSDTVFTLTIESEDPIWYYCATAKHCQNGMVGVINAPSSGNRTIENFVAAAAEVEDNVAPTATQGGTLGEAATGTGSSSTPTESSGENAGIETRGEIRWGLMGLAMAGLFGVMMV
ncbi:Cupredoxin [Dactylonectria macrodidyma]|uniref:Cupredoxin n=1 Tax=Dactylonectria macrodidyma TaxID=307937 RepID=A0A9P9FKS4_9HYPO|nr:Cupredoxin [Dactylonectria macrodidyma]